MIQRALTKNWTKKGLPSRYFVYSVIPELGNTPVLEFNILYYQSLFA